MGAVVGRQVIPIPDETATEMLRAPVCGVRMEVVLSFGVTAAAVPWLPEGAAPCAVRA
jgi:hypothetical protein